MPDHKVPAGKRLLDLMRQVDLNQQELERVLEVLERMEQRLARVEARLEKPAAPRR